MALKIRKTIVDSKVDLLADPIESVDAPGHAAPLANHARAANAADAVNGPAIIGGKLTGTVTEDEITFERGQLTIDDVEGEREFKPLDMNGSYGRFTLAKDGSWTYQMRKVDDMPGEATIDDTFFIESVDGTRARVTMTIHGTNDLPTITQMGGSGIEGGIANGSMLATDPDDNVLTYSIVGLQHGRIISEGANTFEYKPDEDFYGWDYADLTVRDQHGGSVTKTMGVYISNVWDAPFGSDKSVKIAQGSSHTVAVDDFGFSDRKDAGSEINSLDAVIISAVSGAGELWLGNAEIDLSRGPMRVSKADIEGGKLVWKSDAGASGEAHITFNVKDDAGSGDVTDYNTSKDANTLTINAVANGAAIIGGKVTGSVKEDEITFESGQLTIDDVDGEREFKPVDFDDGFGHFHLAKDGAWTYQLRKNDAMPAWAVHESTFDIESKDGTDASVKITVKGTNDAPVITGNAGSSTAEGVEGRGMVVATDPDFDPLTYYFEPKHGKITFVVGNEFRYQPDHDFYGMDMIDVTVSDGYGGSTTVKYGMLVTNVWDAPFGSDKSVTLAQGSSHTVAVDDFGFSDRKDAGSEINSLDAVIISAVSGAGKLWLGIAELDLSGGPVTVSKADIEAGKLVWKPNAGASGEAQITFNVKDDAGFGDVADYNTSKDANTLTIKLVGVNQAPSFTLGANQVVNEDAGSIDVSGMASGISAGSAGENGQVLTFTLTNDNNALFSEQPTMTANGTLRYELADNANGVATVSVTLKDNGGTANGGDDTSDTLTFTITANPINDAPRFSAGANQTVDEDSGPHSVGWATGISTGPADESAQTLAFTVTNDNHALFKVQPSIAADGTLTYELSANANGTARVSVVLTDSGSGVGANRNSSAPITFVIDVAPVNDAPVVSVANSLSIAENTVGALLGQVTTKDAEGQAVSYQIAINTGSAANPVWTPTDLFEIVGDELRLAPGKSLDYEAASSISLRIFATETAGPAPKATAAFTTIKVIDVNENPAPVNQAPILTSPNADSQIEAGKTISLVIGDTHFTDPDGTDLNYSISVNGAGLPSWMTFDTTTGAFTGKPTSTEAGNYVITVVATDGALVTSDAFNLLVTSPAAPEPVILLSGGAVAENAPRGTVAGTFTGTDANGDDFASFSLGDIPGKVFRIVKGELLVRADANLDFETKPVYDIKVIARDAHGATFEKMFSIKLTDVVENPVGTKGNDKLFGDALDNIINGRGGNDMLTGGDGADTFVFGRNFGKDTIVDFDPADGDVIDLSRIPGIENFDDLLSSHAAQSKTDVTISTDDGAVLTIANFIFADLKADMFIF